LNRTAPQTTSWTTQNQAVHWKGGQETEKTNRLSLPTKVNTLCGRRSSGKNLFVCMVMAVSELPVKGWKGRSVRGFLGGEELFLRKRTVLPHPPSPLQNCT